MKFNTSLVKLASLLLVLISACSAPSSVEELMKVDRSFSQMAGEEGMNAAFSEYIADDGIVLRANARPFVGRQVVIDLLSKTDDSKFTLTWEPSDGMISESGDMGFTFGIYTIISDGAKRQGTSVTVWKKEGQDNWKFVLDAGNEGLGD